MPSDDALNRQFRTAQIITIFMLVVAPLVYLGIALAVDAPLVTPEAADLVFWILLIVAIITPALLPVVERYQIRVYRKQGEHRASPVRLMITLSIINAAWIETVYIYSLIVYLVTGDMLRMLTFWPVGIIWSFVYWPRRSRWSKRLEDLEA